MSPTTSDIADNAIAGSSVSCPEMSRLEAPLSRADGLVFDCDGTLLDTMPIYYESWKRACDELGLELPIDRFYAFAGRKVSDIFQTLIDEQLHLGRREDGRREGEEKSVDVDDDIDGGGGGGEVGLVQSDEISGRTKVAATVTAEYCETVKRRHHKDVEAEGRIAGPIDVVVDIALRYHGKLPMAVASSGWRDHVMTGLERVGILHLFDEVVTADEDAVGRGKPAPDIFLVAAKRLGVCPTRCVGFEDADLGMEALRTAGYLYASDVRRMHMYPRNFAERDQHEKD